MSRTRDPRDRKLDEGWEALERGDLEEAIEAAEELLEGDEEDLEAHRLLAWACLEDDRHDEAEPHLRRALELDPGDLDCHAALGDLLFETCRFEEAGRENDALLEGDPEDPRAHRLAALLAERRGDLEAAEAFEKKAYGLDPERFPLPPRFTHEEFDHAVETAAAELPSEFRDRMDNLAILVEDVPSEALLRTMDDPSPLLLGLFVGTALPDKSLNDVPRPPDAIYLFKRNLERFCESREELVEEIRITLLHEVGHFLGLDEEQIEELGFG